MPVATPLSVTGRWIVDANGRRVRLAGVNWAGAHEDEMVPGGLDYRHRDAIAAQVAAWGFNSVRLTFAVRTVSYASPVNPARVSANPDLVGMTPWQVYQAVAASLTTAGVMVIPNCHLQWPGWCCSGEDRQGLWWNDNWPASRFAAAWQTVAKAFAASPLVIGYDLKNEPRPALVGGVRRVPSWGDGNPGTDFRLMYSNTADLIHAVDPGVLVFCEGLSYAGDLTRAGARPVTPKAPGKVVYSLHDYPWFHPAAQSRADYAAQMHAAGGYLLDQDVAPVWIGEFGTNNQSPSSLGLVPGGAGLNDDGSGRWFQNFLAWAQQEDIDTCWWHLSGTHVRGTTPVTNVLQYNLGDRCGDGIFAQSWEGPSNPALIGILQSLQVPTRGPGVA